MGSERTTVVIRTVLLVQEQEDSSPLPCKITETEGEAVGGKCICLFYDSKAYCELISQLWLLTTRTILGSHVQTGIGYWCPEPGVKAMTPNGKSASRTGQGFQCPGNSCLKGHLASWTTSDRPQQLLLIWFLVCSWIFAFQRCRDLDSDPSSLVLGSWLKPWMEGPICLIFLLKQGLQKMIHPEFCFTLWSASLPAKGAEPRTFTRERRPHVHATQLHCSLPPPRQPDSIPQNFLPLQPYKSWSVISHGQQQTLQPGTRSAMFRQPFHVFSAEKQEKKLSHYYIVRYCNHLRV